MDVYAHAHTFVHAESPCSKSPIMTWNTMGIEGELLVEASLKESTPIIASSWLCECVHDWVYVCVCVCLSRCVCTCALLPVSGGD